MNGAQPQLDYLTPEEYLAGERLAETKSEYFAGEVYAFAGTTWDHGLIVGNLVREIGTQFKGRSCQVCPTDLRVQVSPDGPYTYPDVVAVCGEPRFVDDQFDTLLNPTAIIEVLSDSTEARDRGWKLRHYQKLASVEEIVLVAQDLVRVEQYIRQPSGLWLMWSTEDMDDVLRMPAIQCEVPLREIYDKVEFLAPAAAEALTAAEDGAPSDPEEGSQ